MKETDKRNVSTSRHLQMFIDNLVFIVQECPCKQLRVITWLLKHCLIENKVFDVEIFVFLLSGKGFHKKRNHYLYITYSHILNLFGL